MHAAFLELRALLADGCTINVEFLPGIAEIETYAEEGMRAKLVSCRYIDDMKEVIRLGFDFRPFDKLNETLETANYYGRDGKANLTARQSGFYDPKTTEEHIYFEANKNYSGYFKILELVHPKAALYHAPLLAKALNDLITAISPHDWVPELEAAKSVLAAYNADKDRK